MGGARGGGGLIPRKATVLRFPLSSPPPPDSSQPPGSSLKEILCSDVGSLLGRRRAQHKGAESELGAGGVVVRARGGGGTESRRAGGEEDGFSVSKGELKCFYRSEEIR